MPRPSLPPTPASSTDIKGRDRPEMEVAFALPPPALSGRAKSTNMQTSPPMSPIDQPIGSTITRKRTLSGTSKPKFENATNHNVDLPPPPSRARKIIHMKPKQTIDEVSTPQISNTKPQPSQKKKQPSSTSAAGRKIARKTAHSIIERRRRSKMNEEFGVLKDMIPACNGVEMHKLAILQAGIEYVRYLQGCVERLQDQRGDRQEDEAQPQFNRPVSSDSEESPKYRQGSVVTVATASTNPSPDLRPMSSSHTGQGFLHTSTTYSTSPPPLSAQKQIPTGVSPAFNAINFSPDIRRTSTRQANISGKPSPNILPLPQAALPVGNAHGDSAAEANATAALMMLTHDRRGASRGGMSVKELLSG